MSVCYQHRIEKLLVVNDDYELQGLITIKDIEKARKYPNANKDQVGRLLVGAALGISADLLQKWHFETNDIIKMNFI